jgi:hypothetical protein
MSVGSTGIPVSYMCKHLAWSLYCEVVQEGFAAFGFENIDSAKKCVLDFHTFRDKLSLQGLQYTPEDIVSPEQQRETVPSTGRKSKYLST